MVPNLQCFENPLGYYVYYLWARDGTLLYVGKSTNVLARLGAHLSNPERRHSISRVTMREHDSEAAMSRAEACAIRELAPVWNVMGRRCER